MKNKTPTLLAAALAALFALASFQPVPANSSNGSKNKVTYERIGKALKTQKVNINTADVVTLSNLQEVGPELARRIIYYRNNSGEFKNIAELKKIKGIDDAIDRTKELWNDFGFRISDFGFAPEIVCVKNYRRVMP